MLRRALSPRLVPAAAAGGAAPKVDGTTAASVSPRGACQALTATGGAATADLVVPRGGLVLRSRTGAVRVNLRRYSDAFGGQPIDTVAAGGPASRSACRPTRRRSPWRARLTFARLAAGLWRSARARRTSTAAG